MRYIALILMIFTIATVMGQPVRAATVLPDVQKLQRDKTAHVLAEKIATRIRTGLAADPAGDDFVIENTCRGDDCTVSIYRR